MEYDDRGNILERTFQDQGDGSNNRYDHFEYTDSTWGDLLTKYNDTTITYDTIGNPLSYRDGITMTWKNGRRLATFTKGDVSASFDYDADGLRTTKTVGTRRVDYYRAGGLLLGEVHTDGDESYTINYMYDESGRMLGFRLDGAEYYYVRDYSGDVTGLINARGELIGSYLYDPWGVLLETYLNTFEEETSEWTDADRAEYMRVLNLNPIRYKSYYYDTETGFYYLQSRYYDPITTRFINADGVVSGIGNDVRGYNMFVYCMNNPINMEDSNGNWPKWIKTAVKWVSKKVVKPTVKTVQKVLGKVNLTYSKGVNYSGTPGAFNFNFQGGISVDTKGNVAIQVTNGTGFTTGSFGGSVTRYESITCAPSIDKLEGLGYQIGGSYGALIYGVPVSSGGDVNIIPDDELDKVYFGATFDAGLGTPGGEFHVGLSDTVNVEHARFNIFDIANALYIKIMEW